MPRFFFFACKSLSVKPLILSITLILGPFSFVYAQDMREQAVQMAREGNYQESIAILKKQAAQDDLKSLDDLIVVLNWDRQDKEALDTWSKYKNKKLAPPYVKIAVADAQINLAKYEEALFILKQIVQQESENLKAWLLLAHAAENSGKKFDALSAFAYAQRLDKNNAQAQSGLIRLLSSIGGFNGAIALTSDPGLSLKAGQAALGIRWSDAIYTRKPEARFNRIDAVLVQLDHLIQQAKINPEQNKYLLRQLLGDRIVALRMRERWSDTVTAALSLREGGALPDYVKQAEADALLALRRPEQAATLYKQILADDPKNKDAMWALMFAELESENFQAAFEISDKALQDISPWMPREKTAMPVPNGDWLSAQITAALLRSWSDMPQDAWDRLLPLANAAPASSDLRLAMGSVAAARGLSRKSEQETRIAASIDPESKAVKIALGESAVRRKQWSEAQQQVDYLVKTYPQDSSVRRLAHDLSLQDRYELQLNFTNESQSGNAIYAPGSGYVATARLYSPSFAQRWRMLAATERMTATIPEGAIAMRNRFGLGAEYQTGDVKVEGVVWQNTGDLDALGASLNLNWKPTDHWSFEAGVSKYAGDTPLRAIYYGTTANSATAGVTYSWDDSRSISAVYKPYNFSDGNVRQMGMLTYSQKVISQPRFNLTVTPSLYTSTNTRQDVTYYSPLQDFSANFAIRAEHIIYRRYEKVFGGRLRAGVGVYQEANYAGGIIGDVSYEQFYRPNDDHELTYGVGGNHRIYDGVPENTFIVYLRLNSRF